MKLCKVVKKENGMFGIIRPDGSYYKKEFYSSEKALNFLVNIKSYSFPWTKEINFKLKQLKEVK